MSEPEPAGQTSEPFLNPIYLFDVHLKEVEELHIPFFEERIKLEETYIANLTASHSKFGTKYANIDKSLKKNSSCRAWLEIAESVEQEAKSRSAFISAITADVLSPLVTLKNTHRRIRDQLKADLKETAQVHIDYCESTLPRLKRNYFKKMQDAEEHIPVPTTPLSHKSSPTTPTSLSELAHQGKRAIKGFFQEGTTKQGAMAFSDQKLAEEADREYRKGIRHAETLRLKRAAVIHRSYVDLREFIKEKSTTVQRSSETYLNCMRATSTTIMQLASHHSSVFEIASPCGDQDQASRIVNQFDTAFNNNVPRVLYYNYYVGESKDLLFGVSLADYAAERGLVGGSGVPFESRNGATVPVIVKKCIKEIETRGLQAEGIYQESGQLTVLQELKSRVEKDEMAFEFNSRYHDVYCVASLLKLYLRELPEPVFRLPIQERMQHTEDRDEQIQAGFPVLRHKIKQLPLPNQVTLRTIIEHLSRIAAHNHQNATKARNLARAIGTTLFGQDDLRHFSPGFRKDAVLEDMISFSGLLYDDKASTQPAAYSPHRNSPLDDPLRSPPADLNPPTKQNAVSPPRPFIKAQSTSPETNHLAVPQIRAPIPRPQRQSIQPLANGVSESKNRSFGKIPRISFITEELGATEQDPADNVVYPWQSGEHSEFEFLHAEVLFNPADFGLPWHDYQQLPHYRNQQFLIITSPDKATIFNLVTKTTREFKWPLPMPPDPLQLGCCIISPDGNTVIRKLPIVNQPVEAIDLKTRLSQSILPVQYAADAKDLLRAYWKGNAMLYLPVREKGLIIRWSLLEIDPVKAFQTLQVMDPITRHENIQVFVTSDEKWWVALGTTCTPDGSHIRSGLLEVHDVQNEESRLLPGRACCIVETDVYDRKTPLLIKADCTADGELSLQVQSLGASPDDHQFKPVDVSYDMLRTGDTPTRVFSLDPLPVVAVITALGGAYFFEFNTGALLFSTETLGSSSQGYPLLPQWQDGKGFHLPGRDGVSTWVTVNEKDLIGWVRQVLKNDTLASLIAVRTGLPGAHDITMHDMFRNYTHISRASTLDKPFSLTPGR